MRPEVTDTTHAFVLNGDGNSRFRQVELTAAATASKESQIYLLITCAAIALAT